MRYFIFLFYRGMEHVRLLIQMIQTRMSTTGIITLQSGKSPCAPAVVLVLPKNEQTKYRSPAVDSQLMWAWKRLEVREKVKVWMSPSATPPPHFEWDREKKKMVGGENLVTDKEVEWEGLWQKRWRRHSRSIPVPFLALRYHLSNSGLCFSHKVSVELIHWSANSNAESTNSDNLF